MDRPDSPSLLDYWFRPGKVADYRNDRGLYNKQEEENISQEVNPGRFMTVGQVSALSGHPLEDIASQDQYRDFPESSAVPHIRSVPTMTNGPEVQGPYDIRQGPDDSMGRPAAITYHYPQSDEGQQEATPQVRQRPGNLQLPNASLPGAPQPESFNKPISTFQSEPGPPIGINRIDPHAPADRYQQLLAQSTLKRESQWPRNYGGGGEKLYNKKVMDRSAALEDQGWGPDDAKTQAVLELTGGTQEDLKAKRDNLKSRTNTSEARGENIRNDTDLDKQKFAHRQQQDAWMNDLRNRQFNLAKERHREGVEKGNQSNELGWARLNDRRWYEDNMLAIYGDNNKAGRFSPEEQDALHQGMGFLQTMKQRDLTPGEESTWGGIKRFLGVPEPPHYTYQPRPPLTPPSKGTAAPMSREAKPTNLPGQASKGTPAVVKNDADYEKLPSGTQFMGPDGKQRTKP